MTQALARNLRMDVGRELVRCVSLPWLGVAISFLGRAVTPLSSRLPCCGRRPPNKIRTVRDREAAIPTRIVAIGAAGAATTCGIAARAGMALSTSFIYANDSM